MKAMVLSQPDRPLSFAEVALPDLKPNQLLLRVLACGVCRTDLHVYDGELSQPKLPLILGHEIVGRVEAAGQNAAGFTRGERVGVPWLGATDGTCPYCRRGQENLCDQAGFTGYTLDGGYAEYTVADQRYCFRLPDRYPDANAAPLLCAGLIGYRAYRMAGDNAEHLGIYGFGAAAHIIAQVAVQQGRTVYAFTRPGDRRGQEFARSLGAAWAGGSDEQPPHRLDAAILFAPLGALLPQALSAIDKGGRVICAGIHMSDIPSFPYRLLWEERQVISVANLTRQDGIEFMQVIAAHPVHTRVKTYPLAEANRALSDLRAGVFEGAAVLIP